MKISFAVVASFLAGSAMAAKPDTNLMATEARIQMGGLVHAPTKQELAILDQVVLNAFNLAYEGQETLRFESKSSVSMDDATMIISEFVSQGGGGYCQYCGPDDVDDWECYIDPNCGRMESLTEEQVQAHQAGKVHFDFEKKVCKKLRKSGVANFAQVKDCSFSFVETPGTVSARVNEEDAYESLAGAETDAELSFRGLTQELSIPQRKFLESVVLQAHADAFLQTGYELVGLDITNMVATADNTWIGLARAKPTADDSASVIAPSLLVNLHETFEHAVCRELQDSGLAVFSAVNECRFRFVYNPVHEAKAMMPVVEDASA